MKTHKSASGGLPIVFIDDAHTFGGAQIALARAIRAIICNTSHSVVCVCPVRTREAISQIAGQGKQLGFVECPAALPFNIISFPLRMPPFFRILHRLQREGVAAWWLSLSGIEFCLSPLLVLKAMGAKFHTWIHCTESFSVLITDASRLRRILSHARDFIANHFVFRLHPALVTPSESASETVRNRIRKPPVIQHLYSPTCSDAESHPVAGDQFSHCEDGKHRLNLWMIGRVHFGHKNNTAAVEAFRILKKRGLNVSLTIVGDGPHLAALRAICSDLNPADGLIFSAWSLNPWLGVAPDDIVLIPSFSETLCLVAVEALLRGVRIVTSPLPVFHELYPEQFIASGFSGEALADQVKRVAALDRSEVLKLCSHSVAKFSEERFLSTFAAISGGNIEGDGFEESFR